MIENIAFRIGHADEIGGCLQDFSQPQPHFIVLFAGRNVTDQSHRADDAAFPVSQGGGRDSRLDRGTVAPAPNRFDIRECLPVDQTCNQSFGHLFLLCRDKWELAAHGFLFRPAEEPFCPQAPALNQAGAVKRKDRQGRGFHHGCQLVGGLTEAILRPLLQGEVDGNASKKPRPGAVPKGETQGQPTAVRIIDRRDMVQRLPRFLAALGLLFVRNDPLGDLDRHHIVCRFSDPISPVDSKPFGELLVQIDVAAGFVLDQRYCWAVVHKGFEPGLAAAQRLLRPPKRRYLGIQLLLDAADDLSPQLCGLSLVDGPCQQWGHEESLGQHSGLRQCFPEAAGGSSEGCQQQHWEQGGPGALRQTLLERYLFWF